MTTKEYCISDLSEAFNKALAVCMDPASDSIHKILALADAKKGIERYAQEVKRGD